MLLLTRQMSFLLSVVVSEQRQLTLQINHWKYLCRADQIAECCWCGYMFWWSRICLNLEWVQEILTIDSRNNTSSWDSQVLLNLVIKKLWLEGRMIESVWILSVCNNDQLLSRGSCCMSSLNCTGGEFGSKKSMAVHWMLTYCMCPAFQGPSGKFSPQW